MKDKIDTLLNDVDTKSGKAFAIFIQSLIFISILTFSIDTLQGLSAEFKKLLYTIELLTVSVFTIEYIARVLSSDNKIKFIFSFYGLIDLVAIVPFYMSAGVDLRTLRIFRLFRLFRILKMVRYNKAINRFYESFASAKEELVLFAFASGILLYLSSVGIYFFEHEAQPEVFASVFHSMWWSIITLTTVGYGDAYPITTGGKVFTFFILIIGLGVVAVPTAIIASAMSSDDNDKNNS